MFITFIFLNIIATLKVSGSLKKSTEVMKMVNGLARLPELSKGMQELSMEMTKVIYVISILFYRKSSYLTPFVIRLVLSMK